MDHILAYKVAQSNFLSTVVSILTMSSFLALLAISLKCVRRTESVQKRKH